MIVVIAAVASTGCQSVSDLRCYPYGCRDFLDPAPITFNPFAQDGAYEALWSSRMFVAGDRVRFEWEGCAVVEARLDGLATPDTAQYGQERLRYILADVSYQKIASCSFGELDRTEGLSAVLSRRANREGDYQTAVVIEPDRNYPSMRMSFDR
jgi:hypothetical protein